MWSRSLTMLDEGFVIAAGVHQGVTEDWHSFENSFVVNRAGQVEDGGGEPARIERHGAEGVAEDVAEEVHKSVRFGLVNLTQFAIDLPLQILPTTTNILHGVGDKDFAFARVIGRFFRDLIGVLSPAFGDGG